MTAFVAFVPIAFFGLTSAYVRGRAAAVDEIGRRRTSLPPPRSPTVRPSDDFPFGDGVSAAAAPRSPPPPPLPPTTKSERTVVSSVRARPMLLPSLTTPPRQSFPPVQGRRHHQHGIVEHDRIIYPRPVRRSSHGRATAAADGAVPPHRRPTTRGTRRLAIVFLQLSSSSSLLISSFTKTFYISRCQQRTPRVLVVVDSRDSSHQSAARPFTNGRGFFYEVECTWVYGRISSIYHVYFAIFFFFFYQF